VSPEDGIIDGIEKMVDGGAGLGKNICIIGGSGVGIDMAMFMQERGCCRAPGKEG
jgi:hypothetical protein